MYRFSYEGPVKVFDRVVSDKWIGETMAVSEEKARSNLAYQYKKETNRCAGAKITLPGKITIIF